MRITCHSTGSARSWRGTASPSTARRFAPGLAGPAGGWRRCTIDPQDRAVRALLFADDNTPLPVLEPGRGKTRTGRLWCYAVDPRPWTGPGHPAAAYLYSEDRKGEHPATHLKAFRGVLQVDGY